MSDFFHLLSRYFWLVALAFAAFNYWRANSLVLKSVKPSQLPQARGHLRNCAIGGALPWLVMGVGQLSGATPTVWHYFRPQDGNPSVLAWFGIIFAESCLFAWWVYMRGGAKKVVEFNLMAALGQQEPNPPSESMVKLFAALGLLVPPVWVFMVASMNAPLPG